MDYDMARWAEIATLLPDRESFQELDIGIWKKNRYINRFLPELRDGVSRRILDIGAGTGVFCHVCQELGHDTVAVLLAGRPNRASSKGYKQACAYFGVTQIDFTWGSEPANFEDESFDLVNSQGMMGDNVADVWPVMLDDMFRVLKPGGLLVIAANHESGTKHAGVINEWANVVGATLIEYWRKKTIWKFKK